MPFSNRAGRVLACQHLGNLMVLSALTAWVLLGPAFAARGEQEPMSKEGEDSIITDSPLAQLEGADLSLSDTWHVLGPFQAGTRETAWRADPLEAYNGFSNIRYDPDVVFASALGLNGAVRWSSFSADELVATRGHASAALTVEFPGINWSFLQSIYGWAALQYEAFARGNLTVTASGATTVAISTPGLLEIWIDKRSYFGGDLYSYQRSPLTLTLEPGTHVVELRLYRDVRALGGQGEPRIKGNVEVNQLPRHLIVDEESVLTAEMVAGKLVSPLASFSVRNPMHAWAEVVAIRSSDELGPDLTLTSGLLTIAPFQFRPIGCEINNLREGQTKFSFHIIYKLHGEFDLKKTRSYEIEIRERSMDEAQKLTFLHPSGIMSYAIIRPPLSQKCHETTDRRDLPAFLGLHGAGLEADGELVRHMLDDAYGICAWLIFPTGVTPWSGDDWHSWGSADVQASVSAIPNWMREVGWDGPGVSMNDWIISGHSNGGQGTWFFLSHQPDKVIAAAPVSGYTSIENYVPYTLWQNSEASLARLLDVARQSFKHELLVPNFVGIPIHQQHGSDDDNVPVYHSRLMHQLINEYGWHSTYDELPGKGHWFEGVLTTDPLLEFYGHHAKEISSDILPVEFSVVVPNDANMGSKGGLVVDQLQSPDRYAHIHVVRDMDKMVWLLKTSNVHRFHLIPSAIRAPAPREIIIDELDKPFEIRVDESDSTWFVANDEKHWTATRDHSWKCLSQRRGRQVGTIDAVLNTVGPFTITFACHAVYDVALQISRNLFQYFGADSQLMSVDGESLKVWREKSLSTQSGNVVTVGLGEQLRPSQLDGFPIRVESNRLLVRHPSNNSDAGYAERSYAFEPKLGAIFLRPLPDERLELVVWGADLAGTQHAARLVPMLTGTGQPDFVVVCARSRGPGRAGVYAAGFFDRSWRISSGSYIS